jgi:hypothetical protein
VVLGLATGFAGLSFVAAVNLGYDAHLGGKEIIAGWGYALLALLACTIASVLLGWRSHRAGSGSDVARKSAR